jgi:hypothetical protein
MCQLSKSAKDLLDCSGNLKGGGLSFSPEDWSAAERAAKTGFDTQPIT